MIKFEWKRLTRPQMTQPGQFRVDRGRGLFYMFCAVFAAIGGRAVMLHLFPSEQQSLHSIADNQYQKEIELAPYRGSIFDRKGEALAISIKRPSIAVNPRVFDPDAATLKRLATLLRMPLPKLKRIADKKSYFAWVARQVDSRVADEVRALELKGLVQITESARFYPTGSAAAHIIGFVGLDNGGLAGIERQFERDLRGQPRKISTGKDARGQFIVSETDGATPMKPGHSIHLTVDRVLQEIAEDELEAGVKKARAKSGYAIVTDPHTGRILAIANYPNFDPNAARSVKISETANHALMDAFEPGSVMKPFIVSAAIEGKKTRADEVHDCENGALRIGKNVIHDDHPAKTLTTTEAVVRSSNICTYKIAVRLGREKTYETLKKYGFGGGRSVLGFPGEAQGRVSPWEKWIPIRFANVSFGHGMMVTGLELVQAMGAIANGGTLMKPTLIDKIVSADGVVVLSSTSEVMERPIGPSTAREMRQMLRQVVEDKHGTASQAKTLDFSTAGKTGTAQKVEPGVRGYSKDKRIASFIGFAPVEDPHLVVYVLIDEPGNKPYYGGLWAAPVFSGIISRSLKYLNVAPDINREVAAGAGRNAGQQRKL